MSEITLIEVDSAANPSVAVIWMHGLGADGSDFEPIVPELGLAESPAVRFIFPNAPYRPVTCNGGYVMRAWYDIISLEPDSRQIDETGLLESREIVRQLIQREEKRGIPSQRIFLAGFSQGGAVAYLSALTHPEPLAGVIALSTYIPEARLITEDLSAANRHIPLFVAHGTDDDVVSITLGRQALALLEQCGLKPAWHTYDMPHSVCINEVRDIGTWLNARISALEAAP
jgi:phospholipase/carboxylesterase